MCLEAVDWNDLKFVLALHEAGSLAGAARILKVEHSTVGRRLVGLEEQLGARLFHRTPAGYRATSAGRAAVSSIGSIAESVATLERQVYGDNTRLAGAVCVAAPDSFGSRFIAPRLGLFQQRYPDIQIVLMTTDRPVSLSRREADVVLRISRPKRPNVIARRIGAISFALFGSPHYLDANPMPIGDAALDGHRVLGFAPPLTEYSPARWFEHATRRSHIAGRSNSVLALAEMASAGLGISLLPGYLASKDVRLRRAGPAESTRCDLWMVVHSDLHRNARVKAVMDGIHEIVASDAPLLCPEEA
jgi:DNA-binding transcriptional LysR family regulator